MILLDAFSDEKFTTVSNVHAYIAMQRVLAQEVDTKFLSGFGKAHE